ncbi:TPA_asm: hypothetical protein G1Q02_04615 [Salmonella enterica subsp. enterica serovar Typhimurium]|nr:hypothetical protein [Salmonella enterica subsp. enterica serovar Typhimurium]
MKKRLTKKEMVEKRNSDLEINRRLNRVFMLSLLMSGRLHFNPKIQNELKECMSIFFSYFADDVSYVSNELRKRNGGGKGLV